MAPYAAAWRRLLRPLLVTVVVPLLLLTFTTVAYPAPGRADRQAGPPAQGGSPAGDQPGQPPGGASASAPGSDRSAGIPRVGKAVNPYDMNALRGFDAGSHR